MFDITALGEILIDFTPEGKNLYSQNAGGAPANVLATVSNFGGKAAFIGKVGKDIFGDFLVKTLSCIGVNTSGMVFDDIHNTTLAFVSLSESGDRSFAFYRNFGADIFLKPEEVKTELIKNSKIFHFGSLSLTSEPSRAATDFALKTAKESGLIITFDPNFRPLLWNSEKEAKDTILSYIGFADIMKVSKEEEALLGGSDNILKAGVKILLVTDGANGAYYHFKGATGFSPALKLKAKDTTGAGDIFFGTFISEFLKGGKSFDLLMPNDVENYIKKAVEVSGLSTMKKGAISSIPEYKEAKKL